MKEEAAASPSRRSRSGSAQTVDETSSGVENGNDHKSDESVKSDD